MYTSLTQLQLYTLNVFYLPPHHLHAHFTLNHPVYHPPTHSTHPDHPPTPLTQMTHPLHSPTPLTHPLHPLHSPTHSTHSTHPLHSPTHSPRPLHPPTPLTHLLVGLLHNVSCLPLVLLFESLRESIPLRQVTLALLLCPAETMSAHE